MVWDQLEDLLSDAGVGVRTYNQFANVCMDQARSNPNNALPYFLLGVVAERFADAYYEQPLSITISEKRRISLKTWVQNFSEISKSQSNDKYVLTNSFVSQELSDW